MTSMPALTIDPKLAALPNWLVWRLVPVPEKKKADKVPYWAGGKPRSGTQGSPEDRVQLVTYPKALEACQRGGFSGVGFAHLPGCGVITLDFDECVFDGVVDPRVLRIAEGTYWELSPSGTGVHAIFWGEWPHNRKSLIGDLKVEVFSTIGFVTFSGTGPC